MLDKLRAMSVLTSGEAFAGTSYADRDRLIEVLLIIKGNMLSLDAAETLARDDTGTG